MRHRTTRRSNLFLLELILAILFFSLSGAVCMQLFLKARTLSAETSAQNHALTLAKRTASSYESGGLLGDYSEKSELTYYYDTGWGECSPKDGIYRMDISSSPDPEYPGLTRGTITVSAPEGQVLCSLNVSCYQPDPISEEQTHE